MKRFLFVFVAIIMIMLMVSGCSGNKEEKITEETKMKDTEVDVGINQTTIKTDTTDVTYSTNLKKSVDIPNDYPHKIIPVYKDMFIGTAAKNNDGSFAIIGFSNGDFKDIVNYYEDHLKEAEVIIKNVEEDTYMNMGNYMEASYTVTANPADEDIGYKSMISIIVIPGESMSFGMDMEETNEAGDDTDDDADDNNDHANSDSGEFIIPENMSIPSTYPIDAMPIMKEKEGKLAITDSMDGKNLLGYMTKSEFKDVVAFYENIFDDVENSSIQTLGATTFYKGVIDGITFEIGIIENNPNTGENPSYKTLIQVIYY